MVGKLYAFGSEQLFYGNPADRKFAPRKGDLTSLVTGEKVGRFFVTSVPEPQSWALLVLGFGVIGTVCVNAAPSLVNRHGGAKGCCLCQVDVFGKTGKEGAS